MLTPKRQHSIRTGILHITTDINICHISKMIDSTIKLYFFIFLAAASSSFLTFVFLRQSRGSQLAAENSMVPHEELPVMETTASAEEIVVDLSGAVKNPGMYTLPGKSRVGDLLSRGGGIDPNASAEWVSKNLNLSEVLKDTQKIYIPFEWDLLDSHNDLKLEALLSDISPDFGNTSAAAVSRPGPVIQRSTVASSATTAPSANPAKLVLVNVNTAGKSDLEGLPGVGQVTAQRIIDNRKYSSSDELKTKAKISDTLLSKFKDLITF